MAANDGEHPVTELFGYRLPAGTGAPGSAGTQGTWNPTGLGRSPGRLIPDLAREGYRCGAAAVAVGGG
jgi:hypothetical protein